MEISIFSTSKILYTVFFAEVLKISIFSNPTLIAVSCVGGPFKGSVIKIVSLVMMC